LIAFIARRGGGSGFNAREGRRTLAERMSSLREVAEVWGAAILRGEGVGGGGANRDEEERRKIDFVRLAALAWRVELLQEKVRK
jgi:hypothetical protein